MIDIKEATEKIKGFKAEIPEYGPLENLVDFIVQNGDEIEYALAHQDRDLLEEVMGRFAL